MPKIDRQQRRGLRSHGMRLPGCMKNELARGAIVPILISALPQSWPRQGHVYFSRLMAVPRIFDFRSQKQNATGHPITGDGTPQADKLRPTIPLKKISTTILRCIGLPPIQVVCQGVKHANHKLSLLLGCCDGRRHPGKNRKRTRTNKTFHNNFGWPICQEGI